MRDPALTVRRYHQQWRPVRIHMIRSTLRVVLEHEHHTALPESRLGQRFSHSSQRQIVVCHESKWRPITSSQPRGVIVGQSNNLQRGHLSILLELRKLGDPDVGTTLIQNAHAETRKSPVSVIPQIRLVRSVTWRPCPVGQKVERDYELAIVPKRDSRPLREIPQISTGWFGHIVFRYSAAIRPLVIVRAATIGIV